MNDIAICPHGNAVSIRPSIEYIRCKKCDDEADKDQAMNTPAPTQVEPMTEEELDKALKLALQCAEEYAANKHDKHKSVTIALALIQSLATITQLQGDLVRESAKYKTFSDAAKIASENMETEIAALKAEAARPVDMLLFCPKCNLQHIDGLVEEVHDDGSTTVLWDNPPHRSHLCLRCGAVWRPSDRTTNGVAEIKTIGKGDTFSYHKQQQNAPASPAVPPMRFIEDALPIGRQSDDYLDSLHADAMVTRGAGERELLARALCQGTEQNGGSPWDGIDKFNREHFFDQADAILAAGFRRRPKLDAEDLAAWLQRQTFDYDRDDGKPIRLTFGKVGAALVIDAIIAHLEKQG